NQNTVAGTANGLQFQSVAGVFFSRAKSKRISGILLKPDIMRGAINLSRLCSVSNDAGSGVGGQERVLPSPGRGVGVHGSRQRVRSVGATIPNHLNRGLCLVGC